MKYYANEFSVELPKDLKDKSVNIFSITHDAPSELSVVVTRNILKNGQDLRSYVDMLIDQSAERLPKFRVSEQRDLIVGNGQTGVFIEQNWSTSSAAIYQLQVLLMADSALCNEATVLSFTLTCNKQIASNRKDEFFRMLKTIELRSPLSA